MGGSNGMMDAGNVMVSAPYYIGGSSGTLAALGGVGASGELGALRNIGRFDPLGGPGDAIKPVPMRVSQMRFAMSASNTFTGVTVFAYEVHKVTGFTAQDTGGGTPRQMLAINRKTTGYPTIPVTEIDMVMANTGALTVGTYTVVGGGNSPVATFVGQNTPLGSVSGIWFPSDLCPLTLEANEGLVLRNALSQAGGTSMVWWMLDFLRQ